MAVSVEPAAIRADAHRWTALADEMATIQGGASRLWLAPSAFFVGNFSEIAHYPAYQDFWQRMVDRLRGAEVEFELIGIVLRRIADRYEETDQLSSAEIGDLYTVTDEDLERIAEPDRPYRADALDPPGPSQYI